MKASLLYRIASVLLLLFAIGHTLGFRQTNLEWGVGSLIDSMRSIHFDAQGFSRTYWDFFSAFGFFFSVFLLFAAVFSGNATTQEFRPRAKCTCTKPETVADDGPDADTSTPPIRPESAARKRSADASCMPQGPPLQSGQ
jgi:hypothetical protein